MRQPVLADVEITRAPAARIASHWAIPWQCCPARLQFTRVQAAFSERLHLVIDAPLLVISTAASCPVSSWIMPIVEVRTQFHGPLSDHRGILLQMSNASAHNRVDIHVKVGMLVTGGCSFLSRHLQRACLSEALSPDSR